MPGINSIPPSSSSSSDSHTSATTRRRSHLSSAERRASGMTHQAGQSQESNAFLTSPLKTGKEAHKRSERQIPRVERFADMRILLESAASIEVPPEFQKKMGELRSEVQGILNGLGKSFQKLEKSTNLQESERAKKRFEAQYQDLSSKLQEIRDGLRACVKPSGTESKQGQENIENQHSLLLQILLALFCLLFFTKNIPSCFKLFELLAPNSKAQKKSLSPPGHLQRASETCQIDEAASIWRKVDKFGAAISFEFDDLHKGKPIEFLRLEMDELRAQLAALQVGSTNSEPEAVSLRVPSSAPASTPAQLSSAEELVNPQQAVGLLRPSSVVAASAPVLTQAAATSTQLSSAEELVDSPQAVSPLRPSSVVVPLRVLTQTGATPTQLSFAEELVDSPQAISPLRSSSVVVPAPVLTQADATPIQLSSAEKIVSSPQAVSPLRPSSEVVPAPVLTRADAAPAPLSSAEKIVGSPQAVSLLRPSSVPAPVLTRVDATPAPLSSTEKRVSPPQAVSLLRPSSVPAPVLTRVDATPAPLSSTEKRVSPPQAVSPLRPSSVPAPVLTRVDTTPAPLSSAGKIVASPQASEPVSVPATKMNKQRRAVRRFDSEPGFRTKYEEDKPLLAKKGSFVSSNSSVPTSKEIDEQIEELGIRTENFAQWLKPTLISFDAAENDDNAESKNRLRFISELNTDALNALRDLEKQRHSAVKVDQLSDSASEAYDSAYGSVPNASPPPELTRMSLEKRKALKDAISNLKSKLETLEKACHSAVVDNVISADSLLQEGVSLPRNFVDLQLFQASMLNVIRKLHQWAEKVRVLEDEKEALEQNFEKLRQEQAQHGERLDISALEQNHLFTKLSALEAKLENQGHAVNSQGREITNLGQQTRQQGRLQVEQEEMLTRLAEDQNQLFEREKASGAEQENQKQELKDLGQVMIKAINDQARENKELRLEQAGLARRLEKILPQLWQEHYKFEQKHQENAQIIQARLEKKYAEVEERVSSAEATVQFSLEQQQTYYKELDTRIEQLSKSARSSLDKLETELQELDEVKLGRREFEKDKELLIKRIREELQYLTTEAANPLWEGLRIVENAHENFLERNWNPLLNGLSQIVPQIATQVQETAQGNTPNANEINNLIAASIAQGNTLNANEINNSIAASITPLQEKFDDDILRLKDELFIEAKSLMAGHIEQISEELRDLKQNLDNQHENIKNLDENITLALQDNKQKYRTAIHALCGDFSKRLQTTREDLLAELSKVEGGQGLAHVETRKQLAKVRGTVEQHQQALEATQEQFTAQDKKLIKEKIKLERAVKNVETSLQKQIDTVKWSAVTHEDLEQSQAHLKSTLLSLLNSRLDDWSHYSSAAITELREGFTQLEGTYAKFLDEKWDVLMTHLPLIFESKQQECIATFIESTKELVGRIQDIEVAHKLSQGQIEFFTREQVQAPLLTQQIVEIEKNIKEWQQNGQIVQEIFEGLKVNAASELQKFREESQKGDHDLATKFEERVEGIESVLVESLSELEKKDQELKQLVQRISANLNGRLAAHEEKFASHDELISTTKQGINESQMRFQHGIREDINAMQDNIDHLQTSKIDSQELRDTVDPLHSRVSSVWRELETLAASQQVVEGSGIGDSPSFRRVRPFRSSNRV